MVAVNADGRIVLVNSQTEKLFGYHRDEMLGQPVEALIPERFWNQHRHHRTKYSTHPQFRPMGAGLELFGIRKNGTEFPLEISLSSSEDKRRRADFEHDPRHYRPQEGRRRPATVRSQFPHFGGRQLRYAAQDWMGHC